jgi:hypothetical protein
MILKEIYSTCVQTLKQQIRSKVELIAEETFEDERSKGYVEGALEFGEDIEALIPDAKERLRLKYLKDLDLKKSYIYSLWETMIDSTARFKTDYMVIQLVWTIIILILLLLKLYPFILIFAPGLMLLGLISAFPGIFNRLMFLVTGLGHVSDELFYAYYAYGRIEAAIVLSDYRKITFADENRKRWVFSTSHKKSPS